MNLDPLVTTNLFGRHSFLVSDDLIDCMKLKVTAGGLIFLRRDAEPAGGGAFETLVLMPIFLAISCRPAASTRST